MNVTPESFPAHFTSYSINKNDMTAARVAIDPLWQVLCPSWTLASLSRASRFLHRGPHATRHRQQQCLRFSTTPTRCLHLNATNIRRDEEIGNPMSSALRVEGYRHKKPKFTGKNSKASKKAGPEKYTQNLEQDDTDIIYARLRSAATHGHVRECRQIAEFLVKERREQPNVQLYNALIESNVDNEFGAAWRVHQYLDEMKAGGLTPDVGTCHAVLKVVAVHLDHLLRTDVLEYMKKRWFQLSEDGEHDVIAGLLRDSLFEQALDRLDNLTQSQMRVEPWLYDMAVYILCEAGEIEEAFRIMRMRSDTGERNLRRSVWAFLLDKASDYRHHAATSLVWSSQVTPGYLNPSSGICMNVLATAARSGDAFMATEVFSHLGKRGTAYKPVHFELLIEAYLTVKPADVNRAISILTIMPMEKLEPTSAQTRSMFLYLRDKPQLVKGALITLRDLHEQGRKISIAALNLLIECYVEQNNLDEAMKIYKIIHTFAPMSKGSQKSFANIETFNLLLKGCRTSDPPDAQRASFLVSELLALRVIPTSMTYDRLILVFLEAAKAALQQAQEEGDSAQSDQKHKLGLQYLDWSFRHFTDMQPAGWMPRLGTLESLAVLLAKVGDDRCWDVLQVTEDEGTKIEGFEQRSKHVRRNVEESWHKFSQGKDADEGESEGEEGVRAYTAAAQNAGLG